MNNADVCDSPRLHHERAAFRCLRAARVLFFGMLAFLAHPSRQTMLLFDYCRAGALFNIAEGLEEMASAMSFNPS